jgi:multidrug transporter EmrE-like cation transporter
MPGFFLIILTSLIGVAGDFFFKLANSAGRPTDWKWVAAGIVLYVLTVPSCFWALKYSKLSSFGVIYSLSQFLLLVVLGILYFHEKLNIYEMIGVIMAVASIFLLARFA